MNDRPSLRILHLEDDPADAALVAETLRSEGIPCQIVNVDKRDAFDAALEQGGIDLILADYHLPSFDGVTAHAMAAARRPLVPFIFVSGTLGEDIAVERLKNGAVDYVLKQRLSRLPSSVRRAIREAEDATKRARAEEEVRRLNAELEQRVVERTAQLMEAKRLVEDRESELRDAKSLLEDLLAASPSIVFRIDPENFTITYASPNVGWLLGYDVSEIIGVRNFWRRLFHASDLDRAVEHLHDALSACAVHVEHEYRLRGKDGRYRWFFSLMRIEYDERSRPITILWYCSDISDRRAAQQALLETEERTRAILRTANDAFIGMDTNGCIVEWNERAEAMFGWPREEAMGRILSETIIPTTYREAHRNGMSRYEGSNKSSVVNQRIELQALRRDGTEFPVELTIWVSGGATGRTFNAFVRDITERKRADAAIRQAKEDAERANLAKSEFLSRMSHDLRTPMNAVLGFAQILAGEALSAEQHDSVRQIMSGGRHLLDLINEVLDIARIESGRLGLSPEAVGLRDVLTQAVELIAPLASHRHVSVVVEDGALREGRAVVADRQRLSQVLLNLLSNAVKYNCTNGRVIVSVEEPTSKTIRVRVTDTGPGISPDKLQMLFTPFERLGAESTGVEGTGLGLALSRSLAEAMNGSLGVETETGRGSTFWVELASTVDPGATIDRQPAGTAASPTPARAATVLYIEDNISNVRLMGRVLNRRPGVTLVHAERGGLGLAMARARRPDAIFLDLHLPDMGGDDVLREIRSDAGLRAIPVIVLTADATNGRAERLRALGANHHLTKPFEIDKVLTALDSVLMAAADTEGP
jgi:PAS domain S-box-containing protein